MLTENQKIIENTMTEGELQDAIIDLAHLYKWRVMHSRPARLANGEYRTALSGDSGFPDLVMAKSGREPLFWELKSSKGKLSEEQKLWYFAIPNCLIVKPENWLSGECERILRFTRTVPKG
jgi:hypothetical protein